MGRVSTCQKNCNTIDLRRAQVNNIQYFSYHYHHYNEHHISKFWQVRNLRLPFHPYMFLYKALVFQANFLDNSLSSSGYISETNDLRATKICQGMEHDM